MQITGLSQFKSPELNPDSDWCVFSHSESERQMNYLTYAIKRDFLSTPRAFAVIRFTGSQQYPVNFQQFDSQEYFEILGADNEIEKSQIDKLKSAISISGFYLMQNQFEEDLIIVLLGKVLLEITYQGFSQVNTLYNYADSCSAFAAFLSETVG